MHNFIYMNKEILKKMLQDKTCNMCTYIYYSSNKKIKWHCSKKIFKPKYNTCNKWTQCSYKFPIHPFPTLILIIYKLTNKIQRLLHFIGIAWHNYIFDECTTDFNCCCSEIGRFHFNKSKDKKNIIAQRKSKPCS